MAVKPGDSLWLTCISEPGIKQTLEVFSSKKKIEVYLMDNVRRHLDKDVLRDLKVFLRGTAESWEVKIQRPDNSRDMRITITKKEIN